MSDSVLRRMGDRGRQACRRIDPFPDSVIRAVGEAHRTRCGTDVVDVLGERILPGDAGELVALDPAVQIGTDRHLGHHAVLHVLVAGEPVHEHARRLRDESPRLDVSAHEARVPLQQCRQAGCFLRWVLLHGAHRVQVALGMGVGVPASLVRGQGVVRWRDDFAGPLRRDEPALEWMDESHVPRRPVTGARHETVA